MGGGIGPADVPTGFFNNCTHQRIAASPPGDTPAPSELHPVSSPAASLLTAQNERRTWTAEKAAPTHKITHHHPHPTSYPQAPSTKEHCSGALARIEPKNRAPKLRPRTKSLTSFNNTTHPLTVIFPEVPLPDKGLQEGNDLQQKCSPSLHAYKITHPTLVNFSPSQRISTHLRSTKALTSSTKVLTYTALSDCFYEAC